MATGMVTAIADCVNGVKMDSPGFDGDIWPTIYRMSSPYPDDPMAANFDESMTVDPLVLAEAGVRYEYIDPQGFDYPNATAEVPWSPPEGGINDAYVQQLRDDNDYQYADIIVVNKFIPTFWDEHLHEATTIRYMIDGTGYFDLRDADDEWVRIPVSAGDWFEWPAGIHHRFTVDEDAYIQAMRLYKGSSSPDWAAVSRSTVTGPNITANAARNTYVDTFLCGDAPDLAQMMEVDPEPAASISVSEDVDEAVLSEGDTTTSVNEDENEAVPSEGDTTTSVSEDEASSSAARNGVGLLVGAAAFVAAVL